MKEKTLYYRMKIEKENRMINYGFIIVTISNGMLASLEGVFTDEFLYGRITDDGINLEYYSRNENYQLYEDWEVFLNNDKLEIPINIGVMLQDEEIITVNTLDFISDLSEKEKCDKILKKFKNNVLN